ncbi:unannotated protein [freshwater metagenome]|uniref:Unannotated protein n=1 Tax=freshwater metagenome TaxID=449393 RepID=A0A6J6I3F4_9ZZZZ
MLASDSRLRDGTLQQFVATEQSLCPLLAPSRVSSSSSPSHQARFLLRDTAPAQLCRDASTTSCAVRSPGPAHVPKSVAYVRGHPKSFAVLACWVSAPLRAPHLRLSSRCRRQHWQARTWGCRYCVTTRSLRWSRLRSPLRRARGPAPPCVLREHGNARPGRGHL